MKVTVSQLTEDGLIPVGVLELTGNSVTAQPTSSEYEILLKNLAGFTLRIGRELISAKLAPRRFLENLHKLNATTIRVSRPSLEPEEE